jgi:hypothetical protein
LIIPVSHVYNAPGARELLARAAIDDSGTAYDVSVEMFSNGRGVRN